MKFGGHTFLTMDLEREFFDSKGYGTGGDVSWVEPVTTDQSAAAAGKANWGDAFETALREAELYGRARKQSRQRRELCRIAP